MQDAKKFIEEVLTQDNRPLDNVDKLLSTLERRFEDDQEINKRLVIGLDNMLAAVSRLEEIKQYEKATI